MVGFFVNLVALRTRVDGDLRFRELLRQVKDVVRGAHRHQELPFEMVVRELEVDRTLARPPLSPIGFALERAGLATRSRCPVSSSIAIELDTTTSKTDVALIVREHEGGHDGAAGVQPRPLRCRHHCTDAARASWRASSTWSVDPESRVSDLSVRAWRELVEPEGALPGPRCGSDLRRRSRRSPEAVAMRAGAEVLTYRDAGGAGGGDRGSIASARCRTPSDRGGVGRARCRGLLSAMLGIFRIGGVYLPLDPRCAGGAAWRRCCGRAGRASC